MDRVIETKAELVEEKNTSKAKEVKPVTIEATKDNPNEKKESKKAEKKV